MKFKNVKVGECRYICDPKHPAFGSLASVKVKDKSTGLLEVTVGHFVCTRYRVNAGQLK